MQINAGNCWFGQDLTVPHPPLMYGTIPVSMGTVRAELVCAISNRKWGGKVKENKDPDSNAALSKRSPSRWLSTCPSSPHAGPLLSLL